MRLRFPTPALLSQMGSQDEEHNDIGHIHQSHVR